MTPPQIPTNKMRGPVNPIAETFSVLSRSHDAVARPVPNGRPRGGTGCSRKHPPRPFRNPTGRRRRCTCRGRRGGTVFRRTFRPIARATTATRCVGDDLAPSTRTVGASGDFQCQATSDGGVQAQDSTAQLEFLGLLRLKIEASICSELRGSVKSRQIGPAVKLLGLLRQLGPDQSPPPGDIVAVRTLPSPSCPFHDAAGVTPLCVHAHDVP